VSLFSERTIRNFANQSLELTGHIVHAKSILVEMGYMIPLGGLGILEPYFSLPILFSVTHNDQATMYFMAGIMLGDQV
jgi:hypothetical protein